MHNYFITQTRDWQPSLSRRARLFNQLLSRFGFGARLVDPMGDGRMTSVEQRINLFHLCSQVLAYDIPGDIVELGTSRGQTAVIYAMLLKERIADRRIHLFDAWPNPGTLEILRSNFAEVSAQLPILHKGLFEQTVPSELPAKICFASIDLGAGMKPDLRSNILYCLENVYPRLSNGGICVIQSYCDPSVHSIAAAYDRPDVRAAADFFFENKPEKMSMMYSGRFNIFSHAYFRKGDRNG